MSFKNRCTISSSSEFQAHQQRSQRRCCFSQNAQLWFEVLPDAPKFVAGAPRCSAMQRNPSPGRRDPCHSPSEGTRFRQSRQSRPEHPGVSDGNWVCYWCIQPSEGSCLGPDFGTCRENGTIGLEDLPASIQLLEAAFAYPDQVATTERTIREIKQKNRELSE